MKIYLAVLVLLLSTLTLPGLAEESAESYVDEATGLSFPVELSGMKRTAIERYPDPAYGTAFQYQGPVAKRVTLYVYPTSGNSLEAEVQSITQQVNAHAQNSGGTAELLSERDVKLGGYDGHVARYRIDVNGTSFYSEAQVFAVKGSFYKLRLTGLPADTEALGRRAYEITKAVFDGGR